MSEAGNSRDIGTNSFSQNNNDTLTRPPSLPTTHVVEDVEALRHLIGNAAHDLKTPLASFMTGTDIILKTVQAMEEIIVESDATEIRYSQASTSFDDFPQDADQLNLTNNSVSSELCSSISTIKACLQDIINTNQFMLMSINRCIDYTKSTDGLKLKPKYDTIDLLDTLRLPIICMRNTQESCTIYMNPLNPVIPSPQNNNQSIICSHIITDKQWLQENVLCLLSNAVKYSSGGDVSVTVSLVQDTGNANNDITGCQDKQRSLSMMTTIGGESPATPLVKTVSTSALSSASCETILPTPEVILTEAALQTHHTSLQKNNDHNSNGIAGDFLRVEVQDCGIGVPEHMRENLFHPFKQTQKLAGGTGLGLYSLAKRIEALGGRYGVTARSDNQPGSVFFFTIPYRPDWVSHEEAIAAAAAITACTSLSSNTIMDDVNVDSAYADIMKNPNERKTEAVISDSLRKILIEIPPLDIIPESTSNQPASSHHSNHHHNHHHHHSHPHGQLIHTPSFPQSHSRRDSLNSARSLSDENNIFSHSPSTVGTPISFIGRNSRENFTVGTPPSASQTSHPQFPMGKILLVEDSQTIGKMTVAVLTRKGFQVEWVVNGVLAVEKLCQLPVTLTNQSSTESLHVSSDHNAGYVSSISKNPQHHTAIFCHPRSQPYDAVLMDLQMPIMDGLEATKRIREFEAKHRIHRQVIVGLSANSDQETIDTARNVGFDAFMDKPINVDILLEMMGKSPRSGNETLRDSGSGSGSSGGRTGTNQESSRLGVFSPQPPHHQHSHHPVSHSHGSVIRQKSLLTAILDSDNLPQNNDNPTQNTVHACRSSPRAQEALLSENV